MSDGSEKAPVKGEERWLDGHGWEGREGVPEYPKALLKAKASNGAMITPRYVHSYFLKHRRE